MWYHDTCLQSNKLSTIKWKSLTYICRFSVELVISSDFRGLGELIAGWERLVAFFLGCLEAHPAQYHLPRGT